jgi:hypothetical protein
VNYLAWIVAAINLFMGLRAFLNTIHVLQTSKYSQAATAGFALLFLVTGFTGFYFSIFRSNTTYSLIAGLAPWIIGLLLLLFSLIFADYK